MCQSNIQTKISMSKHGMLDILELGVINTDHTYPKCSLLSTINRMSYWSGFKVNKGLDVTAGLTLSVELID